MQEPAPLNYGFKSYDGLSGFFLDAKPVEERSWYGSLGTTQGGYSPLCIVYRKSERPPNGGLKDKRKEKDKD